MEMKYAGAWPRCTTQKEYRLWKRAASEVYAAYGFCTDCTPEYKEKMLAEGRCEHPKIIFRRDKDGYIFGRPKPTEGESNEPSDD
jgi:hypothetical protein